MMWFSVDREETKAFFSVSTTKHILGGEWVWKLKDRTRLVCPCDQRVLPDECAGGRSQHGYLACPSTTLGRGCSSFELQPALCILHL